MARRVSIALAKLGASENSLRVAALLAATGGFLDAFTYVGHGRVFANAMTGNVVLLAVSAVSGDGRQALSHLLMGFDNPFMPGWTFPPAIQDMQRWNGFSDTDVSSIAHQNAESLYPALAGRLQQSPVAAV